jgi:hypothetical protein
MISHAYFGFLAVNTRVIASHGSLTNDLVRLIGLLATNTRAIE